ncbi:tRNA lysidine(34) synthetase TilS [Thalassobaculum litoreum]|uniref:tRNA lysidine(34) synthetase TilS n=1 Tax=Thalassobaculum litoreum TaxID=420996 RepID=UPI000B8960A8|nr:tRNA lysidine(34) synthetase TilS [Thalassobaculum litoreum]
MHDLRQAQRGLPQGAHQHQAPHDQRDQGTELRRIVSAAGEETDRADAPLDEPDGIALLDAVLHEQPDAPDRHGPVALAVSGGPDSTALLYFADRWSRLRQRPLLVLTVDHGLRPEATAEAAEVARRAAELGHSHRILAWNGRKPRAGLQAAAREARLALLTEACHGAGATTLLLAHHRDDQAETVLHRIDRDTGPEGLASMAPVTWRGGIRLVRPFLALPKERLVATCRVAGLAYAEDPSNADPRFTRADLRRLRPALDAVGLTADRLARLAEAMGCARRAMDREVRGWLVRHAVIHPCGTCRLDRTALDAAPPDFTAAILRAVLRIAGAAGYPPGTAAMAGLMDWLADEAAARRRTLRGCLLQIDGDTLTVMREEVACAPPLCIPGGQTACWDGRFLIRNKTAAPINVGPCGAEGWRRIKRLGLDARLPDAARALPHPARLAWPIVTDLDGVVALPHLVLGERRAPDSHQFGVVIHLLATRERRIDGPMANGRLKT